MLCKEGHRGGLAQHRAVQVQEVDGPHVDVVHAAVVVGAAGDGLKRKGKEVEVKNIYRSPFKALLHLIYRTRNPGCSNLVHLR